MRDVLDPLGGEDSLRLFCGVEEFRYEEGGRRVLFYFAEYEIRLYTDEDSLLRKQFWSVSIYRVDKILGHRSVFHSSCVTHETLVLSIFEKYTRYSLSF